MGFSLDMPDEAAIKEQVKAELAPLPERKEAIAEVAGCLLYTSPSPRDCS